MRIAFATECRGNFAFLPAGDADFVGGRFLDSLTVFLELVRK